MAGSILILLIRSKDGHAAYEVQRIDTDGAVAANPAWRLTKKQSGETYTIHADAYGQNCGCADFTFRHQHDGKACKHLAALRECGLIPTPIQRSEPTWAP